jgi:hypothetical protein
MRLRASLAIKEAKFSGAVRGLPCSVLANSSESELELSYREALQE